MASRRLRCGFTLIETLVVIAIIATLVSLLIPAVHRIRDAANRTRCVNNLRQIGLALHHYHGAYNSLPPGMSYQGGADPYPFMSWNTRLLPFLEHSDLWKQAQAAYAQTDRFWKDPPHPLATPLSVYGCPSDPRTLAVGTAKGHSVAFTAYLGVEGTNQFRHDGLLFLDSAVRFSDVTDGLSNTLLVGERPPSANQWLGWWYAGLGQNNDGSAEMILGVRERNFGHWNQTCPPGPYSFGPGRIENQCDLFHFWSRHIGGANFLLADGSVHFLSYAADAIMPALATRAGGEAAAPPN
jgi:prepilin-type N-terminal cleavage/methylation domain-containing protein/prepilin-type processing-associated H-X9-DG protein